MTLTTMVVPSVSGAPVPLAAFGIPTANNINELITDLTPALSARTSYTPAWSSSGTQPALVNGTAVGKYVALGKIGWCTGLITMGSSSTYGTGTYFFSLPPGWTIASGETGIVVGTARIIDTSLTTRYVGVVTVASTALVTISSNAATTDISATVPFTFATTDVIAWDANVHLA